MRINILHKEKKGPWGGGNQFLKALKKEFVKKDIYEEDEEKADIIIFNSFNLTMKELKKLILFKKKGKILIHRVDGPISKYRGKDLYLDKFIFRLNNFLANGTIFQSNYCKSESYKLGMKKNQFERVIMNAPDNEIFNKTNKKKSKNQKIKLIATSWSSNNNKGFDVYKWLDEHLDFSKYEMTFVGNTPVNFKNIKHLRPVNSEKLAKILKAHDIYITASKNDPCSNSLIEAMSCGLPVLARDSGGHPEIVKKGGELFRNPQEVIEKINKITNNYQYYKTKIPTFSLKKTAKEYYGFSQDIHNKQVSNNLGKNKKHSEFLLLKIRATFLIHKVLNKIKNQ